MSWKNGKMKSILCSRMQNDRSQVSWNKRHLWGSQILASLNSTLFKISLWLADEQLAQRTLKCFQMFAGVLSFFVWEASDIVTWILNMLKKIIHFSHKSQVVCLKTISNMFRFSFHKRYSSTAVFSHVDMRSLTTENIQGYSPDYLTTPLINNKYVKVDIFSFEKWWA